MLSFLHGDIADGTSDDCDANGTPDEREPCVCELNCDDAVGAADLAILLGNCGYSRRRKKATSSQGKSAEPIQAA